MHRCAALHLRRVGAESDARELRVARNLRRRRHPVDLDLRDSKQTNKQTNKAPNPYIDRSATCIGAAHGPHSTAQLSSSHLNTAQLNTAQPATLPQ
jgi:hypothetical protein